MVYAIFTYRMLSCEFICIVAVGIYVFSDADNLRIFGSMYKQESLQCEAQQAYPPRNLYILSCTQSNSDHRGRITVIQKRFRHDFRILNISTSNLWPGVRWPSVNILVSVLELNRIILRHAPTDGLIDPQIDSQTDRQTHMYRQQNSTRPPVTGDW